MWRNLWTRNSNGHKLETYYIFFAFSSFALMKWKAAPKFFIGIFSILIPCDIVTTYHVFVKEIAKKAIYCDDSMYVVCVCTMWC